MLRLINVYNFKPSEQQKATLGIHIIPRNLIQPIYLDGVQLAHIHSMQRPCVHTRTQSLSFIKPPHGFWQRSNLLFSKIVGAVRHADAANLAKGLVKHARVEFVFSNVGLVSG